MKTVKDYIRTIADFPHEGILFRDVTTLFADPRAQQIGFMALIALSATGLLSEALGWVQTGVMTGVGRAANWVYQLIGVL